jgi:hypothetical protein
MKSLVIAPPAPLLWAFAMLAFLLVAFSVLWGHADAAPFPARGKFVYSDLCSGPEPWALHGHRVELLHGADGDFVTIEYFNSFDSDVVHSPRVLLDGDTGALWFSYQDYYDENAFEGYVTPQELNGIFDDDHREHDLPRVPNSWPEAPPCPAVEWDESPEFPE